MFILEKIRVHNFDCLWFYGDRNWDKYVWNKTENPHYFGSVREICPSSIKTLIFLRPPPLIFDCTKLILQYSTVPIGFIYKLRCSYLTLTELLVYIKHYYQIQEENNLNYNYIIVQSTHMSKIKWTVSIDFINQLDLDVINRCCAKNRIKLFFDNYTTVLTYYGYLDL